MAVCFRVLIDVGEGTPPVITKLNVDGTEHNFSVTSTDIDSLLLALNSVRDGFTVNLIEGNLIIEYNHSDIEELIITVDGSDIAFESISCCGHCLEGIIGLRGICHSSKCMLYLNDIGIDNNFIEQVITSEYSTPENFVKSQISLAVKDLSGMLHSYMMPVRYASSVLVESKLGFVTGTYKIPNGTWHGIYFQMDDKSPYNTFVSQLGLSTKYSAAIPVCVFDMDNNYMIDCVLINAIAGTTQTKDVRINMKGSRLFIGYKPQGQHRETKLSREMCCGSKTKNCTAFKVSGAYGEINNLLLSDMTGGLSLSYSVSCDHESWICNNAKALSVALLYRTAINIYQYALTSSKHTRVNSALAVNQESIVAGLNIATEKFNKSISDALHGLRLPNNSCFKCNEYAISKLALP